MHHDNLAWSEVMNKWRLDPANKKISVAGDDRTPAWRWIGNLYLEGGRIVIPSDNLMTVLREGGKKVSTGKGQETFGRYTQSGVIIDQSSWPVLIDGKEIPYTPIKALIGVSDFERHLQDVEKMGFELLVKRAKIGAAKHVRVRPRFDRWVVQGTLTVLLDDIISMEVIENILQIGGAYCGLGDWRPSSPKSPGSFGKFTVKVEGV
jgi:hypothetical protein